MPLDPIAFTDFKPGIADNPGIQYPPTQATRENTYRCRALESGALVPGPRRTDLALVGQDWDAGSLIDGRYLVSGFFVTGPAVGVTGTYSGFSDELFLGTEYIKGGNRVFKLERLRLYNTPYTRHTLKTVTTASSRTALDGWGMTFCVTRANRGAPLDPGPPIVAMAWGPLETATGSFVSYFPNDSTPSADSMFDVLTNIDPPLVTAHQGRLIIWRQVTYGHGTDGRWNPSEDLVWTDPNDPGTVGALSVFVHENPDGYAFLLPMSANELVAVKASFGLVIQGDLDDPTVINLPMVPGVFIDSGASVVTPIGMMYGSYHSGVWLWQHGDSSVNISRNMDPAFWFPTDFDRLNAKRTGWANSYDLVYLPNNWFYDTQIGSWWRLEDEDVLTTRFMTVDWSKRYVYGSKTYYTSADLTVGWKWDKLAGASTYSFQTHPLFQSIGNMLKVTSFELIAEGQGTVTITLTGIDGSTATQTIALANNGYPERFRKNISIQGQYIQLRIEADSGDEDVDAATIYSVILYPDSRAPFSTAVG